VSDTEIIIHRVRHLAAIRHHALERHMTPLELGEQQHPGFSDEVGCARYVERALVGCARKGHPMPPLDGDDDPYRPKPEDRFGLVERVEAFAAFHPRIFWPAFCLLVAIATHYALRVAAALYRFIAG
jgi:hypothetical protein